ncbi:hypothetical protein A8H39_01085 [Paraburkholderia fungorum]|uniref:hypothetical protein n=1 Tax=Paraburkholderia fungorum TaxID=134537 RepID=UPI000486220C|nr:hypothetical protein [Paraburkholderia fungorum]PNE59773.1 hypothetical protein A8H39_01085 [Paraburkholderia fungorum]
MLYDHSSMLQFAWAAFAVFISYPLLYWFLRRVKKVRLRFNVTVFVAVVVAGLLPMELVGYEANRAASQLATVSMVFSAEQRIHDTMLVCEVDPGKVPPEQIQAATQRLVDSTATWFNIRSMTEVTSAQWLKRDDRCGGGWLARKKVDTNQAEFQSAADSVKWWLIAGLVTGVIGIIAMYELVVSRLREDMREVQVEERVELKNSGEAVLALVICAIAFLPFSLLWLRLFKFPKAATREPRTSAQ